MFEAKLSDAVIIKRLLECKVQLKCHVDVSLTPNSTAIKELVTDANFDCDEEGLVRI